MTTGGTYTPGLRGPKLAAVLLGLVVTAIGIGWCWLPIGLLWIGQGADAEVVAVISENPVDGTERLASRRAIQKAEDLTRNTAYRYELRFSGPSGKETTALLNYGQYIRPIHTVGDRIRIRYAPDRPDDLVAILSIRTWAFGIFFTAIGLAIAVTQALIFRNANRPIVIDPIAELDPDAEEGTA